MADKVRFEIGADASGAADAFVAVRREFDKTARTLKQQLTSLDTFARLQQQVRDLAREYKDVQAKSAQLKAAFDAAGGPTRAQARELEQLERAAARVRQQLDGKQKALLATHASLQAAVGSSPRMQGMRG